MMTGYLIGVIILGFCKQVSDEAIIKTAYIITIASFVTYFILNKYMNDSLIPISSSLFLYSIGNAFLSPSIFSMFSKERQVHEQGKGFGLIVAADSAAFLLSVVGLTIYSYLSFELTNIMIISSVVFIVSLVPYRVYKKTRSSIRDF